ncbi:hypothetical protein MRX96_010517 [Rhipicephalus microplus]
MQEAAQGNALPGANRAGAYAPDGTLPCPLMAGRIQGRLRGIGHSYFKLASLFSLAAVEAVGRRKTRVVFCLPHQQGSRRARLGVSPPRIAARSYRAVASGWRRPKSQPPPLLAPVYNGSAPQSRADQRVRELRSRSAGARPEPPLRDEDAD